MKMGRLMATFDPRRLLMFAVRVLEIVFESQIVNCEYNAERWDARKANVRIRDLLREK